MKRSRRYLALSLAAMLGPGWLAGKAAGQRAAWDQPRPPLAVARNDGCPGPACHDDLLWYGYRHPSLAHDAANGPYPGVGDFHPGQPASFAAWNASSAAWSSPADDEEGRFGYGDGNHYDYEYDDGYYGDTFRADAEELALAAAADAPYGYDAYVYESHGYDDAYGNAGSDSGDYGEENHDEYSDDENGYDGYGYDEYGYDHYGYGEYGCGAYGYDGVDADDEPLQDEYLDPADLVSPAAGDDGSSDDYQWTEYDDGWIEDDYHDFNDDGWSNTHADDACDEHDRCGEFGYGCPYEDDYGLAEAGYGLAGSADAASVVDEAPAALPSLTELFPLTTRALENAWSLDWAERLESLAAAMALGRSEVDEVALFGDAVEVQDSAARGIDRQAVLQLARSIDRAGLALRDLASHLSNLAEDGATAAAPIWPRDDRHGWLEGGVEAR